MHPTSASLGNGAYIYSASYDYDLRLSSVSESLASGGTTLFSSTRTYDNVGNVANMATILAAGNDNQAFCYDEQNRLTWAGSTGTPPCTGTAITPGSLTSAQYSLSMQYDAMNRLTYNIAGGGNYQYGTAPLHGVTSTVTGGVTQASVSYDAVGDMTCRAPSNATTCSGTVTGQQLTYDAERRLSHWQSSPSSPTSSADYLYDGGGGRIEQVDTSSGSTTKVYYLFGGLEELSVSGSTSTLTKYYSAAGLQIGVNVGGTISYLASDGLGSVSEALSTSGTVTAAQLYGPYGTVRYSSGTMPTAKGFTGQYGDAISGLDYYGARYYDPVLGQFTSADTKQGPNRFAYVADDPETLTDPTGHLYFCASCVGSGDSGDQDIQTDTGTVHIRPKGASGCGVGCAVASKNSATVGPGKHVQQADATHPDVYAWGNSDNGAEAFGFSGENLQALIGLDKLYLKDLREDILTPASIYGISAALVSLFTGLIVLAATAGAPLTAGASLAVAALAAGAGAFAGSYLNGLRSDSLDGIQSIIDGLQTIHDQGGSVWFVQSIWHGNWQGSDGSNASSDYIVSYLPGVPNEVLAAVGEDMMNNCATYENGHMVSQWGNSPGIPKGSDTSYAPQPIVAGCTDVG